MFRYRKKTQNDFLPYRRFLHKEQQIVKNAIRDRQELQETQKLVEKGIDKSAYAIEQGHQTLAAITFSLFELFNKDKDKTKTAHKKHIESSQN